MVILAVTAPLLLIGQGLGVRRVGEEIRFSAPALHFVEGRVLEKLRSGSPVPVQLFLSIAADNRSNVLKRVTERIVLSYDLWEEKVAGSVPQRRIGPVLHASSVHAEAWCIQQLSVSAQGLPAARPLWFRLEIRPEPDAADGELTASAMSIRGLIDTFGKSREAVPKRYEVETGPLRLQDVATATAVLANE